MGMMNFEVGSIIYLTNRDSNNYILNGYKKITNKNDTYYIPQMAETRSSKTGWHRIKSVKVISAAYCDEPEKLELEVEYVAPSNWMRKIGTHPDWFFIRLIKIGFTVVSRDIACVRLDENYDPIKKYERSWFAISPERGVYITVLEHNSRMGNLRFNFINMPESKQYSIKNYFAEMGHIFHEDVLDQRYQGPSPYIFDFLKDLKMVDTGNEKIKYKAMFDSPYVGSLAYEKSLDYYEAEKEDKQKAINEYNRMNRKFFLNLSEKNKEFLWKYTDIGAFFKKNNKDK